MSLTPPKTRRQIENFERLGDAIKKTMSHPMAQKLIALGPPLPEDDPQPACLRCRDLGFVRRNVQPDDPSFGKVHTCACPAGQAWVQARLEKMWAGSEIPPAKRGYTLESLAKIDTTRAELAADLRAWWDNPLRWLVIRGPKGTCKSGGPLALLLEHMRAGGSGLYVSVPDFLKRLRKTYRPDSAGDEDEALQPLIDAQFLILDDLGVEKLTEWGQEKLWTVINRREGLHTRADPHRTVITTNLTLGELPTYLDPAARTWDRIRGWADLMETHGASVRGTAKARAAMDELPW